MAIRSVNTEIRLAQGAGNGREGVLAIMAARKVSEVANLKMST